MIPDTIEVCPVCDGEDFVLLGTLGRITWVRCRHCGADVPLPSEGVSVDA